MGHKKNLACGFTLVELVVIIVLLGILAAAVIPRFVNLREEAEQATFESVRGAFQAGVSLAHAKAMTKNQTTSSSWLKGFFGFFGGTSAHAGGAYTIYMNGVPVDMTQEGWPAINQTASNCNVAKRPGNESTRVAETEWLSNNPVLALGVSRAYAGGGGGGGGDGGDDDDGEDDGSDGSTASCSVLEVVLQGFDLKTSGWTQETPSDSTVTFTSPSGQSFQYNESNGNVE